MERVNRHAVGEVVGGKPCHPLKKAAVLKQQIVCHTNSRPWQQGQLSVNPAFVALHLIIEKETDNCKDSDKARSKGKALE